MDLLEETRRGIARDIRGGAERLFPSVVLALAGGVAGLAAAGFVTAAAYRALSVAIGPGWAALLLGAVFALLSAGLLVLARRRLPGPDPKAARKPPSGDAATDAADAGSMLAFTVAFVLARQVFGKGRD